MKIFITEQTDEEKKCGGCNWGVTTFYGLGKTLKDALKHTDGDPDGNYGAGLCADCMIGQIFNANLEIGLPKQEVRDE